MDGKIKKSRTAHSDNSNTITNLLAWTQKWNNKGNGLRKKKSRHNYVEKRHLNLAMRKCFFSLCQIHIAYTMRTHTRIYTYTTRKIKIGIKYKRTLWTTDVRLTIPCTEYSLHTHILYSTRARSLESVVQSFLTVSIAAQHILCDV